MKHSLIACCCAAIFPAVNSVRYNVTTAIRSGYFFRNGTGDENVSEILKSLLVVPDGTSTAWGRALRKERCLQVHEVHGSVCSQVSFPKL